MAGTAKNSTGHARLSAQEIFESAAQFARDELKRPWTGLSFSGVAGGVVMVSLLNYGQVKLGQTEEPSNTHLRHAG